ncbi:MAG: hypothetical protein LUD16_13475 [Lachnospiraceae bacterium]|nr:hypothetical protein [Lachnospiraceae bacterium]
MKTQTMKKSLVMFLLLFSIFLLPHLSVEAASSKSAALKAYKKFLAQETIPWGDDSYYTAVPTKNCSFAIAYIDNNSVPELIIRNSTDITHLAGWGVIYTWRNGEMTLVGNIDYDGSFYYYKKKGIYVTSYTMGGTAYKYFKLSKGTATYKLSMINRIVVTPSSNSTVTSYYNGSGKEISSSAFNSKLAKLTGSTNRTELTLYKNTARNRKKYLS